jgi:hypothetical protein
MNQVISSARSLGQSQSYVTTDGQSASLSRCQAPIWYPGPDYITLGQLWGTLSHMRTGLSFTIAAGPRQRSHSRIRVPWDSWTYFTVSYSRLPQPVEPGPRIYIPQEHGGPVIPSGTGFPFRRRAKVEVFEPASTRGTNSWKFNTLKLM